MGTIRTAVLSALGRKGHGWLPDPPDLTDQRMRLPRRGAVLPVAHSLERHVQLILDQGATNSCVANAVSLAYCVALGASGRPTWLPSRLFLYWNSRKITGDERVDDGTYLRTCIAGLVKFGAPPEEAWPFAPIRINRMPSATAYHASYDRRGPAGYYRAAEGEPRIEQVRGAIASGYPVVFGTRIDASFNRVANADTIGPPTGEIIGGHAMCIVGYDGRGVRVANSWGSEWGDTGLYWMSYDWLASDHVHDVWAVVP